MIAASALTTAIALYEATTLYVPLVVAIGAAVSTTMEWEQLQKYYSIFYHCR